LLILLCYANAFSAGLTLDSKVVITGDPRIQALDHDHLKLIFTKTYWWPHHEEDLYRPLTTLSYLFNYTILGNGQNVGGYHLVNILVHWANSWLVLLIVRRLCGRLDVAALAAALFAVHPVNTEAVTNIVGRADLLATLCILFGGWCYLRAAVAEGVHKWWWLAALGASACLGVLAKESGVMICAFAVLFDWLWRWPKLTGDNWRQRLGKAANEFGLKGYLVLSPALLLLWSVRRWLAFNTPLFGQPFVDNPIVAATPFKGMMTAIGVIGRYLGLLVFPRTLSSDYSYHQIPLFGEPGNIDGNILAWCSLAVVVALLAAAVWLRHRQTLFAWGVLFFFVMQLPTSNLLFPIGSIMGERFLYLPSIGLCTVAALVLCGLSAALVPSFERSGKTFTALHSLCPALIRWLLPALVVCILGLRTYARNTDWHDDISLWKSAVAASPASFKAQMGYGNALWEASKKDEHDVDAAIEQAKVSLAILDREPLPLKWQEHTLFQSLGVYYQLKGQFLDDRGLHDGAKSHYQEAVDILLRARDVDHYVNQASRESQQKRGRRPDEIADFGNFHIYASLAQVCSLMGDWPNCEAAARYIQHLLPEEKMGYLYTGAACYNTGRLRDAAVEYLAALLLYPADSEIRAKVASCYAALGALPSSITKQHAGFALNGQIPLERKQLNEAAARVVRLFHEAKRFDEAQTFRDKFIKQYSVPAEVFSKK
jgi:tetratricopeptide (TPR) repeat protein